MGMTQEFRDFAVKGNVVDMAVGIIIGGAFGKIVTSFVNDVVMPPVGMLTGASISRSCTSTSAAASSLHAPPLWKPAR